MKTRVCTWWKAYTFDNCLRRLIHKPEKILGDYVKQGMTVLDIGCGMGVFSIGMARMVGERGRVLAVDLQSKMLDITMKRAGHAGVSDRISPHLCKVDDIGVHEEVDFALTFWMVHEVPDKSKFFKQLHSILRPSAKYLLVEPKMHTSKSEFEVIVNHCKDAGFDMIDRPAIKMSRTALFEKKSP